MSQKKKSRKMAPPCRSPLLGEKIAIDVGKAYPGLLRSKVRHQDRSPVIQSEEGRSATSGQPPYRPVDHPALTNKLFGDQRNGAPLKPRHPGQICSWDWLPPPDAVEDSSPVDVSGCLARC